MPEHINANAPEGNPFAIPQVELGIDPMFEIYVNQTSAASPKSSKIADNAHINTIMGQNKIISPFINYLNKVKQDSTLGDTLVGVEVEIEGITNPVEFPYLWEAKQDGSLRNNGIEYVTYPTPAKYIPALLEDLNIKLAKTNNVSYSSRTSVHVHVDVQDLTIEQYRSFVLLYIAFEELLYSFVGGKRYNSIFCVPITHAGYAEQVRNVLQCSPKQFRTYLGQWHKYTGFNLLTTRLYGTIEFRHLYGTANVETIVLWLKLILALRNKATSSSFENIKGFIQNLNTSSEYDLLAQGTFGELVYLFSKYNLQEKMEKSVSFIKECLFQVEFENITEEIFESSSMFKESFLFKKDIQFTAKDISNMSVEELKLYIKTLEILYNKTKNMGKRDQISEEYTKAMRKLDKMQGEV